MKDSDKNDEVEASSVVNSLKKCSGKEKARRKVFLW